MFLIYPTYRFVINILIVNVIGNILVIPDYGIVGASIVTLFSFIILWVILLMQYLIKEKLRNAIAAFIPVFITVMIITFSGLYFNFQLYAVGMLILISPLFFRFAGALINYKALFSGNLSNAVEWEKE